MWDLIVSVPDHCLSFYFEYFSQGVEVIKEVLKQNLKQNLAQNYLQHAVGLVDE